MPRILHSSAPSPEALGIPKCLSPHSLAPAAPRQRDRARALPTPRFGWCPGTGCGCLSPERKGTRTAVHSRPWQLFRAEFGGFFFNVNFLRLLFLNTRGVCLKILLFRSTVAHAALRAAKGCRGAGALAARRPGSAPRARWRSHGLQPKPLGSRCVTACNVCADRANSVEVYADQITPLKRLGVGKESPAKHRRLEARCLLTCNASRGPAGCGGPCFIFYKGCCLLRHISGT